MAGELQGKTGASLGEALRGYVPFTPVHLGEKLSKAQAGENLAQLLEAIPERLKIVVAFLEQEQLDPRSALAHNDPRPFLAALWEWACRRCKTAPQPWRGVSSWRASRRDGDAIVLSLLCDIGVLLAQIIRGFRPEYYWAWVDGREEQNMSYFRQPLLKIDAPRPECEPSYNVFDLIDLAVGNCTQNTDFPLALNNEIADVVSACVLGGYEWTWNGFTVAPPMQSWESFLSGRAAGTP